MAPQHPLFSVETLPVTGFLPSQTPLTSLPAPFETLESILQSMPALLPSGEQGLLGKGIYGSTVEKVMEGETGERIVRDVKSAIAQGNEALISALFRDFCFLSSAWLMEPIHLHYTKTGMHTGEGAIGRNRLPHYFAIPLYELAAHLKQKPFMEYATSYALMNYRLLAPGKEPGQDGSFAGLKGMEYDNLALIRCFIGGESEKGFILTHLEMVSHSAALVRESDMAMLAVEQKDVEAFHTAMTALLETFRMINLSMGTMWKRSLGAEYGELRSFIFGTAPGKGQNPHFPNGVVYEGVSDEPMFFRGESGANDSMIPLADNLLEITAHHPKNELTEILRDFRTYRPMSQQEWVNGVEVRARSVGVRRFALEESGLKGKQLYLLMLDQVREFRDRHWRFTKHYIVKHSTFPYATGGSPILSYLPQNLRTVISVMGLSVSLLLSASSCT
ncbi:hypothetical protein BT69DRAFT_466636 [Atractiella rhizophila]|nr:hypothetical protein BT69DRAFT_466636 [Atractiella rhizophila]